MSINFGKLDFATSFNPTSAFPIDARCYFEDFNAAEAAAATAKEAGDTTTKYYYGQILCVLTDNDTENVRAELYKITPVYDNDTGTTTGSLTLVGGSDGIFGSNLILTTKFGKYEPDETGKVEIPSLGKTPEEVILDAFAEEKDPTITQPSITIDANDFKAYEVGTSITPSYSIIFDKGSYSYGPDTDVTVEDYSITFNSETLTTQTGTFAQLTIEDDTNLKANATVNHTDGEIATTNLGNDTEFRIEAGNVTAQTAAITGYRNTFYGTVESKDPVTSDIIRGLSGKSNGALKNGATFNIPIPVGALRIIIAYPATLKDLTNVLDVNGMNASIVGSFINSTVQVEGLNGATAIDYKVYILDYAAANNKGNTYKVTI